MPVPDRVVPPTHQPTCNGALPPLELRILAPPRPGRRDPRVWSLGILAVFLLTAVASPFLREPLTSGELPAGLHAGEDLPRIVRPTFERALEGDANAMRVVGALYQRGEYLPRDEGEAAAWFQRAAAAGDHEAVKDLEQLGLPDFH